MLGTYSTHATYIYLQWYVRIVSSDYSSVYSDSIVCSGESDYSDISNCSGVSDYAVHNSIVYSVCSNSDAGVFSYCQCVQRWEWLQWWKYYGSVRSDSSVCRDGSDYSDASVWCNNYSDSSVCSDGSDYSSASICSDSSVSSDNNHTFTVITVRL